MRGVSRDPAFRNDKVFVDAVGAAHCGSPRHLDEITRRLRDIQDVLNRDDRLNCESTIFMSQWHRTALDLEPDQICSLKVRMPRWYERISRQVRACLGHPQIVVFLATVLAILGLGVGFIGAGLGFTPMVKDVRDTFWESWGQARLFPSVI